MSTPWFAPGNLRWLVLSRGMRSFAQAALAIAVPLYLAAAGYTAARVGYLLSIASFGSVLMVLVVGFVSDRYGRKPVLLGMAILAMLGPLVYALTTSFWPLAITAGLAAIGRGGAAGGGGNWGPFYPAEQPLIAGSVPASRRNRTFATLSVVGAIGAAAGSLAAGIPDLLQTQVHMGSLDAFHWLFYLMTAAGLTLVLLLLPISEQRASGPRSPARMSHASLGLIGRLWLTNGLNGLAFGVLGPFLTYWLATRYGATAAAIGTLYTMVNLATIGPYLGSAALARRFGSVRAVVLTRGAAIICLAGIAVAPTFPLASAAYVLRMLFTSAGMPIRQSYVMGVSSEEDRSRVAALGNLPAQATSTISPTVAAYLLQSVSVEAPVWMAAAVMGLNTIVYGAVFRRLKPPEEQQEASAKPDLSAQTAAGPW
ncbi:MAG: MFS transporter [Chloroflexota bacterium]